MYWNRNMTSGADLNISQLSILLRILRHKLGVKIFEPEKEMKELYVEIIQPDFGEYMNHYKVDIKPEPFLIWGVWCRCYFKEKNEYIDW